MTIFEPKNLSEIVAASYKSLVVVDCKASWCAPCKAIHPHIVALSGQLPSVTFMEIDVEDPDHQDTVEKFGVTAMPTFIYIRNGKILQKTTGANLELIKATITALSA